MQLSYGIYYSTHVNSSACFERYVAHYHEPQLYLSLWFTKKKKKKEKWLMVEEFYWLS
jgi:hypothetical protein